MKTKYTKRYLLTTPQGKRLVRRRIYAKKDRGHLAWYFGILFGLAAGCLYLEKFGQITIHFIARAIETNEPQPIISTQEGEATIIITDDAGQTAEPLPTDLTERQQILNYIVEIFGDDAHKAIAMLAICENSELNPYATNHNRNGTIDRGVFQINSIHGGEEMFDWKTNVDKAFEIYSAHDNTFYAWTCATKIGQRNYISN